MANLYNLDVSKTRMVFNVKFPNHDNQKLCNRQVIINFGIGDKIFILLRL